MATIAPSPYLGMVANYLQQAGGTSFRVWAPNATAVNIAFASEGWAKGNHPMAREAGKGEYWSVFLPGVGVGAEYQVVIDNKDGKPAGSHGENWRPDAYSRDVEDTDRWTNKPEDLSSYVVDRGYAWSEFRTPQFDDLIIYQAHVGSFAGRNDGLDAPNKVGTFESFLKKLGYIRGLGFNAIEFLPLPEIKGKSGMGYGPTNLFAPESAYGSPGDLRQVVDEAHKLGLAVIFDVVFNHAATEGNRLWEFDGEDNDGGIYFEGGGSYFGHKYAHWKVDVRNFLLDNARMWLEEFRGDGLRFDVAHGIPRACLTHILGGIRDNAYWRDKLMVAEWDGGQREKWPDVIQGIGFNSVWEMNSRYGFADAVARRDPVGKVKELLTLGYGNQWNRVVYLLGSHDNVRDTADGNDTDGGPHRWPVEVFGGRENWYARAQCRMGWALNAAAPGIPMMFMGCEGHHYGYWFPTEDAFHHGDRRLDWGMMGDGIGGPMQEMVRAANRVRWENPALRTQTLEFTHEDRESGAVGFKRYDEGGNVVLVVANFSDRSWGKREYGLGTGRTWGRWREIFNSQAPGFGGYENSGNGPGELWTQGDGNVYINLPQWSVLMFKKDD